jgi:hypothetical protein
MSILASLTLSVSAFGQVLAQDNMTMSSDNMTSGIDNSTGNQTYTPISEITSDNTSEITDAERGLDGNIIVGQ